jgi:uncharacterized protein
MMIWTGFIFGLLNSFHCLGMCGPIALSLPVPEHSNRALAVALYNLGRISTYSLIGLLFGAAGEAISIFGFQQYLSIACGIAMLLFIVLPFIGIYPDRHLGGFSVMGNKLKSYFNSLFRQRSLIALFFIGILNGLLPCGVVYLALAGAAATGSSMNGAFYMAAFGLGTIPVMGFVAYYKNKQNLLGINFNKLIPVFTIATAVLLILRGMNLGIPYVSPTLTEHKVSCCSTTAKCH